MTAAVSHRPADLDRAAVGHRSAVSDRPAVGDRQAFINRIGTAVPANDIHAPFIAFARTLLPDEKRRTVFDRMAERSGIAHRFSALRAGNLETGEVDASGFYIRCRFPGTEARMALYETQALALASRAVDALSIKEDRARITHLIVASCTGFTAPGLDLQLGEALGLRPDLSRTLVGFMGCSAAVPALRIASQAVRADPSACVLVINLELCSLHLQETADIETALSFLLFGDGCAAALVTADPHGIALGDFRSVVIPDSQDLITWRIGDSGFHMHLSGKVPGRIARALREEAERNDANGLLRGEGTHAVDLWAVHGGGRTVLDAVEAGLDLPAAALVHSRAVLHAFGNMSSATLMFVLRRMLAQADAEGRGTDGHSNADAHVGADSGSDANFGAETGSAKDAGAGGRMITGRRGFALAFGPGMVAETFRFTLVSGDAITSDGIRHDAARRWISHDSVARDLAGTGGT
jgi:predicted naringenin-chalcone synthase